LQQQQEEEEEEQEQGRDSPMFNNYSNIKNPCLVTRVNSAFGSNI
jgi:hypothetical protein